MRKPMNVGSILFLVIGLVAIGFAAWHGWQTASFLGAAHRADGSVTADPGSTRTITAGHPDIAFVSVNGATIRYRQNGMGPTKVGVHVSVLYLTNDPAGTATVSGFWSLWGGTVLPLVMGLGFIGAVLLGAEIGWRPGRW